MTKIKTVKIQKKYKTKSGEEKILEIDYAKVSERLREFHKKNQNGNIETSYSLTESMVCFKAKVIPDIENPARFFTGHSLGRTADEKAFEKLETIAVGRALAFLGLLADGEIASADEMEVYAKRQNISSNKKATEEKKANLEETIAMIRDTKDIETLNNWKEKIKDSKIWNDVAKRTINASIDERLKELKTK